MNVDSRNAGLNRASRRIASSVTGLTHVGATGVYTTTAAFLNDLQPGDIVVLSGLTGGSLVTVGIDYYLLSTTGATFAAGATTFKVATTPGGAPVVDGGTNITAGTITKGRMNATDDGPLSGNIVGQKSAAGR